MVHTGTPHPTVPVSCPCDPYWQSYAQKTARERSLRSPHCTCSSTPLVGVLECPYVQNVSKGYILAAYQISCFYHKRHKTTEICHISAGLNANKHIATRLKLSCKNILCWRGKIQVYRKFHSVDRISVDCGAHYSVAVAVERIYRR